MDIMVSSIVRADNKSPSKMYVQPGSLIEKEEYKFIIIKVFNIFTFVRYSTKHSLSAFFVGCIIFIFYV